MRYSRSLLIAGMTLIAVALWMCPTDPPPAKDAGSIQTQGQPEKQKGEQQRQPRRLARPVAPPPLDELARAVLNKADLLVKNWQYAEAIAAYAEVAGMAGISPNLQTEARLKKADAAIEKAKAENGSLLDETAKHIPDQADFFLKNKKYPEAIAAYSEVAALPGINSTLLGESRLGKASATIDKAEAENPTGLEAIWQPLTLMWISSMKAVGTVLLWCAVLTMAIGATTLARFLLPTRHGLQIGVQDLPASGRENRSRIVSSEIAQMVLPPSASKGGAGLSTAHPLTCRVLCLSLIGGALLAPLYFWPAQLLAITGAGNEQLPPSLIRVDAKPKSGFLYPYYLYVPAQIRTEKNHQAPHVLLILPNNTGTTNDDFAVHERSARRTAEQSCFMAAQLRVAMLVPVFPRPATDGLVYTQALNRASLLTQKEALKRLDLQLIAMIDDARERLRGEGLKFIDRTLMYGFSASGMFTNRFTMIHPDRIRAAAFGSPGGWAMAPVASWKGKSLRYPVGTADFEAVTGTKLDLKRLKATPMFLFMGTADTNDSVPYRDSYDQEDKDLIFSLFGKTMLDRWAVTESLYRENLPAAKLKLYPGVAHTVSQDMMDDVMAFFAQHLLR